jgi:exopolysaccharide production protein ExoZ
VIDHGIAGLIWRGCDCQRFTLSGYAVGHVGVAAFFTLSGLILFRQSAEEFGQPGATRNFILHRILRIVPMYWLITAFWFAEKVHDRTPTPHAARQLALSFFFLPNYLSPAHLQPVLQQGWTLDFEMAFYLLFAACLLLPRRFGLPLLVLIPLMVASIGWTHPVDSSHLFSTMWHFFAIPELRLFSLGVAIGWLELKLPRFSRLQVSTSPAHLLFLAAALLALPGKLSWRNQLSMFAVAVVILCTLVKLDHPGWINRRLILLGDASYSTYLVHLWPSAWILTPVIATYRRLHIPIERPALYLVVAVIASNLFGLAVHLALERPLTRGLRGLKIFQKTPAKGFTEERPLAAGP